MSIRINCLVERECRIFVLFLIRFWVVFARKRICIGSFNEIKRNKSKNGNIYNKKKRLKTH